MFSFKTVENYESLAQNNIKTQPHKGPPHPAPNSLPKTHIWFWSQTCRPLPFFMPMWAIFRRCWSHADLCCKLNGER